MQIIKQIKLIGLLSCTVIFYGEASLSWSWGQAGQYQSKVVTHMYPNEFALSSSITNTPELAAEVGWRSGNYCHPFSIFSISLEEYTNIIYPVSSLTSQFNQHLALNRNNLEKNYNNIRSKLLVEYSSQMNQAESFQAACFFRHNIPVNYSYQIKAMRILDQLLKKNILLNFSPLLTAQADLIINGDQRALHYLQNKYGIPVDEFIQKDECYIINKNSAFIISFKSERDDQRRFEHSSQHLRMLKKQELQDVQFILLATSQFWKLCDRLSITADELLTFIHHQIQNNQAYSIGDELITFLNQRIADHKGNYVTATQSNSPEALRNALIQMTYHVSVIYPNTKSAGSFNPAEYE